MPSSIATVSIAGAPTVAFVFLPLAATIVSTIPLLAATSLQFLDWTTGADLKFMHHAVGDSRTSHCVEDTIFNHLPHLC